MKTTIKLSLIVFLFACSAGSDHRKQAVSKVVTNFVKAGDDQNVLQLKQLLHEDYRALVNRLFGNQDVKVIDRSAYLKLIDNGTIGGDHRAVEITDIDIVEHNAYVKAEMIGNDFHFTSYFLLAEDTLGNWKILSDLPYLEPMDKNI